MLEFLRLLGPSGSTETLVLLKEDDKDSVIAIIAIVIVIAIIAKVVDTCCFFWCGLPQSLIPQDIP